jgi:hypothetical protein
MNEPTIATGLSDDRDVFRFLWLRSFHRSVAVRIEKTGTSITLVAKELSGAGGYEPGAIARTDTREFAASEWNELRRLVDRADFWKMPTSTRDLGLDGAEWVLEGRASGVYHVVERWRPERGEYREIGLFLLRLARVNTEPLY